MVDGLFGLKGAGVTSALRWICAVWQARDGRSCQVEHVKKERPGIKLHAMQPSRKAHALLIWSSRCGQWRMLEL